MTLTLNLPDVFMDNWVNANSEKARALSQHPILSVMRWLKRPTVRTAMKELSKTVPKDEHGVPQAGIRADNLWLCYDENRLPRNESDYEST